MQKACCRQDRDNQLSKAAVRQHLAVRVRPGLRVASGSSSYVRELKPGLLVCSGVLFDGPPGIPSLQANRDREGRGPSMLHSFDSSGTALGTPSESLIQRLFSSPDLELGLPSTSKHLRRPWPEGLQLLTTVLHVHLSFLHVLQPSANI